MDPSLSVTLLVSVQKTQAMPLKACANRGHASLARRSALFFKVKSFGHTILTRPAVEFDLRVLHPFDVVVTCSLALEAATALPRHACTCATVSRSRAPCQDAPWFLFELSCAKSSTICCTRCCQPAVVGSAMHAFLQAPTVSRRCGGFTFVSVNTSAASDTVRSRRILVFVFVAAALTTYRTGTNGGAPLKLLSDPFCLISRTTRSWSPLLIFPSTREGFASCSGHESLV